ncbi:MAG: MFS transporter [Vicinamibacterales bacterium]
MVRWRRSSVADRLAQLPRTVWLLGWVSLATDSATEAIYPLLPFFLTQVLGAGAVSLGVIEGAAEAVNSVLKVWSGRVADRWTHKRPLVLAGYSISSLARPFIAITQTWAQVFAIRIVDRVGKGVRSAPRDALLAAEASPSMRGLVFGFHRAMDHAGAVVGPVLATVFLYLYPGEYRTLFALTIVPGLIAIGLILLVREPARGARGPGQPPAALPADPGPLPGDLTAFLFVLALFTLGNSTDAFLLLRLTEAAGSPHYVPLMWAGLHAVKASVSVVAGGWSDRVGRRAVIAVGWCVYAAVYVGFAAATTLPSLLAWFLVYGFYFGFAEGTEKALVADLAPPSSRGFAFGLYNAVLGVGSLLASVLFGVLWTTWGAPVAFGTGAVLALLATALLFALVRR